MAKCIIVGAGDFSKDFLHIEKDDYIIAADGGFEYLHAMGILPHMWIGDMDSTKMFGSNTQGQNMQMVKLPREKDDTDTLAAIRIGIEKGYKEFSLHGMLGGRLDHTLANIFCLQFLISNGCNGILYGKDTIMLILQQQKIVFDSSLYGMLSVFAWNGNAEGVTEKGLLYEIDNATLTPDFPVGVSNELIGKEAEITVLQGKLLISILPDTEKMMGIFLKKMFWIDEL